MAAVRDGRPHPPFPAFSPIPNGSLAGLYAKGRKGAPRDRQCFRRLPGTGHFAAPINSLPRTIAAPATQLLFLPAPPTELDNPWSAQISSGTDGYGTAPSCAQRQYPAHVWEDDQAFRTQQQAHSDGMGAPASTDSSPADGPADRLLRKARLRINDWLLEAATPAAVLRLVSQHGASFNSVNVATALHRLARLVTPLRTCVCISSYHCPQ